LIDTQINRLSQLDPELGQLLSKNLAFCNPDDVQKIINTTFWAFNMEIQLGYTVFKGFDLLLSARAIDLIDMFIDDVQHYTQMGTSLGLLMAEHLPLVLLKRHSQLTDQFYLTFNKLYTIGPYILYRPFKSFSSVLQSGDFLGAIAMLELFRSSFSTALDYHQSKNLTQYLPRLCQSLNPEKRAFQIQQLTRVAKTNIQWVYACETGFEKGLQTLRPDALKTFIDTGITKYPLQTEKGMLFFAMDSEIAKKVFESLQTAFFLNLIHDKLNQYIHARIGAYVGIRSQSRLPRHFTQSDENTLVYNDSVCIYLPDEMAFFSNKDDNRLLYKYLVRWEASHFEWGTYDFDLERLIDNFPEINIIDFPPEGSDLHRYLHSFSNLTLANNLFTLFEHARIRLRLIHHYPGILRTAIPAFKSLLPKEKVSSLFQDIYNALVWDDPPMESISNNFYHHVIYQARNHLDDNNATVETSAYLVWILYDVFFTALNDYSVKTPLNSNFCSDLIEETVRPADQKASKLRTALKKMNLKVYKSDIRKKIIQQGDLTGEDFQELIADLAEPESLDYSMIQIREMENIDEVLSAPEETSDIFHYDEWDKDIGSYKIKYTRVIENEYSQAHNDHYEKTLVLHSGLLRHIRRRFEMIRPEGLKILRRWPEGDAFDYRQLLSYGIDRKIKNTPSDRLYTKRIKEYRDVAVFLLVDLSRSTANMLPQSNKTVLDVEQEAIIIFCEALKQCGDPFAIAGFSSSGRHCVSFYWIKKMAQPLTNSIKNRVGNLAALRSTRMGAAIRHANYWFEQCLAKIRLMIVLSDGFPNDTGYKKDYAIQDTRKAIQEAYSKGIHVHGITVNLSSHAQLNDLYGKGKYHVISDVTELPDQLPIIYYQLTKSV